MGANSNVIRRPAPLPDPGGRLTPTRKVELVEALRAGRIRRDVLLERYGVSEEELAGWEQRFQAYGIAGLAVTKLQWVGRG